MSKPWMTSTQYRTALDELKERHGLTTERVAAAFGFTRRQAARYAAGDAPVPKLVAERMRLMLGQITVDDLMLPKRKVEGKV